MKLFEIRMDIYITYPSRPLHCVAQTRVHNIFLGSTLAHKVRWLKINLKYLADEEWHLQIFS